MEAERYKLEIRQVGENIRNVRIRKGLSQFSLEALCGIDRGDISRIENGRLDIQFSTLIKLAEALEITTNELFYNKN